MTSETPDLGNVVPLSSLRPNAPHQLVAAAELSWAMHTSPTVPLEGRRLVILGEAPGADEEIAGVPFVGQAGKMLTKALETAGLDRRNFHILNTFLQRPPNNDLKDTSWTLNKTEFRREYGYTPTTPQLKKRYLRPEHEWQLEEARTRLRLLKPDLIIAMGATALWLLTGEDAITTFRGSFFTSPFGKAIATMHPAAVLYQYSNLPLLWADLVKVRLMLEGLLPEPLVRRICISPAFDEIEQVYNEFKAHPEWELGVDIETAPAIDQITTVSFSTPTYGIVIPIWDRYAPADKQNFWSTAAEEVRAWRWIERFAQLPNPKVMQNGLYDAQYLMDAPIDIRLRNWCDDTSVMQHSYQPELPKALGVLASLYLNEPSWKHMRVSAKDAKADE